MNMMMVALWASVVFGVLTAVIGIAWFATGRTNMLLQRLMGICVLLAVSGLGYGRFIAS